MSKAPLKTAAIDVIETEARAILELKKAINDDFHRACEIIEKSEGHVVVIGMGKSGHVGGKIAATLASTGTPAFFVHPGEASHGDIGMLTKRDVVLLLSYSGHTDEVVSLIPSIEATGVPIISMTGNTNSPIAKASHATLNIQVKEEACPLGLAPTTSSTASLVMGDALAITLLSKRGFTKEDFARAHPGGSLGRKLLLKAKDVMHQGDRIPIVNPQHRLNHTLIEMTNKRLGFTTVVDKETGTLLGIFTDGDLRRTLDAGADIHATFVQDVMTENCMTINRNTMAAEALRIMNQMRITALVVIDGQKRPIGVVHMHDLIEKGLL